MLFSFLMQLEKKCSRKCYCLLLSLHSSFKNHTDSSLEHWEPANKNIHLISMLRCVPCHYLPLPIFLPHLPGRLVCWPAGWLLLQLQLNEAPVTYLRLFSLLTAALPYLSQAAAFMLLAEFPEDCSRMQHSKGYVGILWQRVKICILLGEKSKTWAFHQAVIWSCSHSRASTGKATLPCLWNEEREKKKEFQSFDYMELCLTLNYCSAGKAEENRCHDYYICKGIFYPAPQSTLQPAASALCPLSGGSKCYLDNTCPLCILAGVNKGSEMGRDLGNAEYHVDLSERVLAWMAQARHGGHLV